MNFSLNSSPTVRGLVILYTSTLLAGMWAMIVPAIPVLAVAFEISLGTAAQIVTASGLGRFVGLPISGAVLDRLGARSALIFGPAMACAAALPFESGHGGRAGLWALAAAFLALSGDPASPQATLYVAAAGLMLVTAVIETSFLLAYRDSLTGLPGRRALTDALERLGGHYSIAMVDVDHFKRVNDLHGHDTGDQVLRLVAARLATVGMGGTAYRYGGEEFAIVFPGRAMNDVRDELERVREVIASRKFQVRGLGRLRRRPSTPRARRPRAALEITVSIGVADAGGRGKADDVIHAADRALYKAKDGGRNRVEV